MSRPKSSFLSAFGIAFQIWKALVDEVLSVGGSDEDLRRIENDNDLRLKLAELIVSKSPKLLVLEFVGTVSVPATTSKFVAHDNFKLKQDGGICSHLDENFKSWFLEGDGKTKDPISEQTLRYHKLRKSSVDGPIIAELGGEEKSETTLTEMFSLMEKQKNGEDGVLLNNGYANIFYIKDISGVLRTVDVYWFDDSWDVSADAIEYPDGWFASYQVFSRKPSET